MPTLTPFSNIITFSRGSNATVVGPNGLVQWAPSNLLTFSEQFDNVAWSKTATVTANQLVSPDGTTNADLVSTTGNFQYVRQLITATANAAYTVSFFVKPVSGTPTVRLYLTNGPQTEVAGSNFSLVGAGSLGTLFQIGTGVVTSRTITQLANGWYRCTLSGTVNTTSLYALIDNHNTGTMSFGVWGAQLELGTAATTYNPTTVKNLLGFSEAFDNAAWTKTGASIVTGAAANPINGLFNAQKLMENTAVTEHLCSTINSTISSANSPCTTSVFIKAGERTRVQLRVYSAGSTIAAANFNLSTLVFSGITAGSWAYQTIGNGWYRLSCATTHTNTSGNGLGIFLVDVSGNLTYTGDGNSGIFIYGAQLSDSASLDPYVPTPGAAPSSTAYYGPRFDYDPVTLQPRGLLIEEQRTNLLTYSEQFDNAAWTKASGGTGSVPVVTSNAALAPDGTITADQVVFNLNGGTTSSDWSWITQGYTAVAGGTYSISLWARTISGTAKIIVDNTSNDANLADITTTWTRVSFTRTDVTGGGRTVRIGLRGNNVASGQSGSATVLFWGAQLEAGTFATSYIPTIASTVTRSADVATITGQNFGQFYQQSAGTFVVNLTPRGVPTGAANVRFLEVNDGTATSRNPLMYAGPAGTTYTQYRVAGVDQANMGSSTSYYAANSTITIGAAYATNDFATSFSGGTVQTDTSGSVVTNASELDIGYARSGAGTEVFCGHIRSIRYIPVRAADFQLQDRTK